MNCKNWKICVKLPTIIFRQNGVNKWWGKRPAKTSTLVPRRIWRQLAVKHDPVLPGLYSQQVPTRENYFLNNRPDSFVVQRILHFLIPISILSVLRGHNKLISKLFTFDISEMRLYSAVPRFFFNIYFLCCHKINHIILKKNNNKQSNKKHNITTCTLSKSERIFTKLHHTKSNSLVWGTCLSSLYVIHLLC